VAIISTCTGDSKEQKEAKERAADVDTTVVSSCSIESVRDTSISTFSWSDTSDACLAMKRRIYRYPTRSELRFLSKTIYVLHSNGSKATYAELADQVMSIVQARHLIEPSQTAAMHSTMDTVVKIYSGMGGRVTPKDLSIMLWNAGNLAQTVSDEGLIHMAALADVMKDKTGQP
jgi:hypothetical protein